MLEHDVAGLVISPCYGDGAEGFRAIERANLPALQVLRRVQTGAKPLPFFSHDYASGSYLAARHLLDQGVENIAFIGGIEGREITAERMSGYLGEMQARGLPAMVHPGPSTRAFGRSTAKMLLQTKPDINAAICFNDLVALGLCAGLTEAGKVPGEDFFVIGFDDIEEAQLAYPSLSTIRCDVRHFGKLSAKMLLDMIEEQSRPETVDPLPVELVVRSTSTRSVQV
jgi:LacI family transcriptional regulator